MDDSFAEGLARHARAVAERYPWIDAYTPVNEPLTTARFSGLYGVWYPHGRDDTTFIRCLLNECKATVLAMQEIRQVNPDAQLIQTDDLGKTSSTRKLRYQADFDNERRWLSWDLLCGRVDRNHKLWWYLRKFGASEAELMWFKENRCVPDVLGVNYYVTSERFLDDDISQYPESVVGSNGKHFYADVESVRVKREGIAGAGAMLEEAWQRYGLPVAITEAHLGCTREEQQRWLLEVWNSAEAARQVGVDVRAVTVWSMLGAYNWSCLLTHEANCYEPGVFDLRAPEPRETGLARVVRSLAADSQLDEPALQQPGWWRRDIRYEYMPKGSGGKDLPLRETQPVLITGGRGTLASSLARSCDVRGIPYRLLTREEMDITNPAQVCEVISDVRPWAVINAAGFTGIDEAEIEIERCMAENGKGPAILAEVCQENACRFVTFSCDQVFDGEKDGPYTEDDRPNPVNLYGRSKAIGERITLARMPEGLVIRSAALFSDSSRRNEVWRMMDDLSSGRRVYITEKGRISPTYAPHLANATLDLLIDGAEGIWHLTNQGATTWVDMMRACAERCGFDPDRVVDTGNTALRARRPANLVLASSKAWVMPNLEEAIERFARKISNSSRRRAYVS
jgi:dTDP-4-dehydrorhamnose reductase